MILALLSFEAHNGNYVVSSLLFGPTPFADLWAAALPATHHGVV